MAMTDITTNATNVLGIALVMRLNPKIIMMVPKAKKTSNQLIF